MYRRCQNRKRRRGCQKITECTMITTEYSVMIIGLFMYEQLECSLAIGDLVMSTSRRLLTIFSRESCDELLLERRIALEAL